MKVTTWQPSPAPARWPALWLAIFVVTFLLAAIVPPFQAPDEFDHINRAYMLSRGQWMLESVHDSPSGGEVDQGLSDYERVFVPLKGDANRQLSAEERDTASGIQWTGRPVFVTAVGTAYYFPGLYIPQAIGLAAGKIAGLRVGQSYRLARYLTLATCFGLLMAAFRLFPPPTFVIALIALPMNLFLLSSAVLDGMATCTAILGMSCFMRVVTTRDTPSPKLIFCLAASIGLVAACRANLLPLLLLPFAAWVIRRDRFTLVLALVTALLVLGWTLITLRATVYPPGARNIDHGARLVGYLAHPVEFAKITFATITDRTNIHFYIISFIGVLGWLDATFPPAVYYAIAAVLSTIGFMSLSVRNLDSQRLERAVLLLCVVAAVLLTFLALLVQWTVGASTKVEGIQGRYFMIPVTVAAYALFGSADLRAGLTERLRYILTGLLIASCTYVTTLLLVSRYYTPSAQPAPEHVTVVEPSEPLTQEHPIPLHFSAKQELNPAALDRIAIRFGTYMAVHPGKAALVLRTNGGATFRQTFDLSTLTDNSYRVFSLDGKRYIEGEIVSEGGVGISTYEVHTPKTKMTDCMQTRALDKSEEITSSCPAP